MVKSKFNFKDEMLQKDAELTHDTSIEGKGMLTWQAYNNSMRSIMFASHLNQFKNNINPDFPQFFTAGENVVGEHSDGYIRLDDCILFKKIVKYEGLVKNPTVYKVFLYNNKKERYEVHTMKPNEDLVEVYGYRYNHETMDSFDEGDHIPQDTVVTKSTSYDQYHNYRYGTDVKTMLSLDPFTSEDACVVSESLAKRMVAIEPERNIAILNDNDYPLNLYGDSSKGEYKIMPDIGEMSKGILMATRRKFNNQALVDFEDEMMTKVLDIDTKYYVKGRVMDIDIFLNKDDFEPKSYNKQIYDYWKAQNEYYRQILETCQAIKKSGEKYTRDINYELKRAREMLDRQDKWKEKDSAFSNVEIRVLLEREVGLTVGQKISGRFGNKSVVSRIVPDDEMPYYYDRDGNKIHIELIENLLGVTNRTIAGVIMELSTTFFGKRISEEMRHRKTMKDKEKILFDAMKMFNPDEHDYFHNIYKNLSTEDKKDFLSYCENVKIHFHQPTIDEKTPFFYRMLSIYEKYSDLMKPDDLYINKFGREIKCLQPAYIGNMYCIILKQTGKKGFSVRGIGAVSQKGVPERSYKSKSHKDLYSSTAIRFGESETLKNWVSINYVNCWKARKSQSAAKTER